MSRLREADFYYGAILSTLLNNGVCPMLIEGGTDRRVYDCTTNKNEFRMFVKYRSLPINTKKEGYYSWQFVFSDKDIDEIKNFLSLEKDLRIGLVCGADKLSKSQFAVLQQSNIEELIELGKTSITVSIMTGERCFRISIGGGRDNSMMVKSSIVY